MNPSYFLGLSFIVLVAILWSLSSILAQYLYQNLNFNSPFLLTYIGTSLFVIMIPSRLLWERRVWQSLLRRFSNDASNDYDGYSRTSTGSNSDTAAVEVHPVIIPWTHQLPKTERRASDRFRASIEMGQGEGRRQEHQGIQDNDGNPPFEKRTSVTSLPLERRNRSRSSSPIRMDRLEEEIASDAENTRLTTSNGTYIRAEIQGQSTFLLSHQDHIQMAMKIAPLWFISNYFYNLSLAYTTITSSTVLSSTGSVFTFIFSLTCGDEKFTKWKVLGVSMTLAGSIFTTLKDASNSNDNESDLHQQQLWGDVAGLISAVGYGGYTVLVRVLCPKDENRMSMQLFLGYIGLINMTMLSPFLLWVIPRMNGTSTQDNNEVGQDGGQGDVPYYETHQLTAFVFVCLVIKGLFDNVLSDYLWARSIILTSATVATVGVGLTIPIALLSDTFVMGHGDVMSFGNCFGALLVLVGFIFVNIGESGDDDQEESLLMVDTSREDRVHHVV